jgi:hypothetical protein
MQKNKAITFVLIMFILSGCITDKMAVKFLPTVSKAGNFKYGGWIIAELKNNNDPNKPEKVSGELIAHGYHQLFILDSLQMHVIHDSIVNEATLYMYKTQPGVFTVMTLIGIMPNIIAAIALPEYAGSFLALGIVPLATGIIFISTEAATKRNQLIFPKKNTLDDFNKFSRFPQGLPSGIDLKQLKLPTL